MMALNLWEKPKLKDGDYVLMRGSDTEAEREDVARQLAENGCKFVRYEVLEDGRLQAHGYLRAP